MNRLGLFAAALVATSGFAAPIVVTDDGGHALTLAHPATRIVSLSPHATEMLFAIGAGEQLVGRDIASDYPPEALAARAVGQYGSFNVEAIAALKPDLVIAWEGPQAGPATARLRSLGVPVYASEPASIDAIPATLRALGNLTGRSDAAEQQALKFEQGWQQLAARYATAPSLTVVPQVGDSPALTVNDHQFVAAALAACHTRNPFGGEAAAVPLIAPEALLAARPDAMVALAEPKTARRWFARWQHLPLHAAMLDAPADTLGRPGPRVLGAAQALCAKLDQLRRR